MRLHKVMPEYAGRVRLRTRPYPLEVASHLPPPRDLLEQEWWLAAIQEPDAAFAPYPNDDWPATTLPAFDAAWCAAEQGELLGHDFDLRVRRAFFSEGRNIGDTEVLLAIATDTGLDMARFTRALESGHARAAVLEDYRVGRERYHVRGTPTLMLAGGTRLHHPIAFPAVRERKVVGVGELPCRGEGCISATRTLFERALGER